MSATQLDTPFLDGGVRSTNFFNGRILSREDLQREQDAERAIHLRLGRATGDGIVSGFEVEATALGGSSVTAPAVTVHPGLAVNRQGQTIALDRDVDVSLLAPSASGSAAAPTSSLDGSFGACAPPDDNVYVTGTGVYLLSVAPAQSKQGLALTSGLGNGNASCNAKEVVDGVQFRLAQVTALSSAELADEDHLRNVAAYKFFLAGGTAADAARDPFGVAPTTASLTSPALSDCDVPLALLHWTATGGLRWVDLWSVRRMLAAPGLDQPSPLPLSDRRWALGQAVMSQFREHLESLRSTGGSFALTATSVFRWLPPVGMVPLGMTASAGGFNSLQLFNGLSVRGPLYVEGARVTPLLRWALSFPPIDTNNAELIWLYFVRENQQAVAAAAAAPVTPYLIFARGQIEYQGEPRFDISRFGYANFSLGAIRTGP